METRSRRSFYIIAPFKQHLTIFQGGYDEEAAVTSTIVDLVLGESSRYD